MAYNINNIRNIGIFAHVDDGKTTLTEQLLAVSGAVRRPGSVDAGTAHTDKLAIERRRGISVKAACACFDWQGVSINLIDTPGHRDFISEVERALWAIDGAVLLINGAEGIRPQTEALFYALKKRRVPIVLFINKIDREGVDVKHIANQIKALLSDKIIDLLDFDGEDTKGQLPLRESIHALLAEQDEKALMDYLDGNIYESQVLFEFLKDASKKGEAYVCLCGSGLKGQGIEALLNAMIDYLPAPKGDPNEALSGIVYAIEDNQEDKTLGKAFHLRLFSGSLANRDALNISINQKNGLMNTGQQVQLKISQIRAIPLEGRGDDIGLLRAGQIGAVYGLGDVPVGQVLGDEKYLPKDIVLEKMAQPLLITKVTPQNPEEVNSLKLALDVLSMEDNLLSIEKLENDLHVRVMGAIQLEVLGEILANRFDLNVSFDRPNVIYRETILNKAKGFYAYTMPKPCWAVIEFYVEPLKRGSGVVFESVVPVKDIMLRYQHQIEQALPLATKQGMLGWQVDDVKITLTGGEHHLIHTHPLDFMVATPIAFLDAMRRGGSVLLEPILALKLVIPEDCFGKIMGEVIAMRGEVINSEHKGAMMGVIAHVPLAGSVDFYVKLAAITGGRGAMSSQLLGYKECNLDLGARCPRQGVHPLDTAKYILAIRNALGGGIFDV